MGDKPPGRFAASEVTYSLPLRVLLTLPVFVPVWLVARLVFRLPSLPEYRGEPVFDVPLAVIGALLLSKAHAYLRDLWRTNPRRVQYDRDNNRAAAGIADRFTRGAVYLEPARDPPDRR